MAKFIKAEDIPADMEALAFWEERYSETEVQFSRSVRGAKLIASKHKGSRAYGWQAISNNDRTHGIMVW